MVKYDYNNLLNRLTVATLQFDLAFYTECPLCGADLTTRGRDEAEAHLTNHYAEQIQAGILIFKHIMINHRYG